MARQKDMKLLDKRKSSLVSPRRNFAALGALLAFFFLPGSAPAETLKLGGLLSLTGNWQTLGESSQIMMGFAQEDLNLYLKQHGSNKRIQLMIRDTQLQPDIALKQYKALVTDGAVSVIGPQSSSEVAALVNEVSKRKVPIISQGSTASSLAFPNDHIYRMVPNDRHEAEALMALLKHRGVKTLIPAWRADTGNQGLHDSLQSQFTESGGTMLAGVRYSTDDQQDFDPVVAELDRQLQSALLAKGAVTAETAIYLAGFDEVARLMDAAVGYPRLKQVKWYGSDGVANSAALLNDPIASQFAMDVGYPNPNLGLPSMAAEKWIPLSDRYYAKTGQRPDAFALAAYDATFVAGLNASYRKQAPRNSRQDIFAETADITFGATGWNRLDADGDRAYGDFDFWAIRLNAQGQREWTVVCHYDSLTGELGPQPCEP